MKKYLNQLVIFIFVFYIFEKNIIQKDFLSFHLSAREIPVRDWAVVSDIVLGDYLVKLGQGLVMWGGFSLSGGEDVQGSAWRKDSPLHIVG